MAIPIPQQRSLPWRDCHASLAMTVREKLGTREGPTKSRSLYTNWASTHPWSKGVQKWEVSRRFLNIQTPSTLTYSSS